MWRLPRTSGYSYWQSRWFESMYTLQEKSDQHVTRFPHSVRVWLSTIRISRGRHIATFCEVINSNGQSHCSWEKRLLTQSTTRRLTNLWVRTQFLSWASHWSSGGKTTLCWWQTTRLGGALTNTSGGYNLGGVGFPHTTPWPSQPTVSPFHLRALPSLHFKHKPSIKPKFKFKEAMAAPWSSDHMAIYCGPHLCLATANDLSLSMGFVTPWFLKRIEFYKVIY
jgi:hypothetical protein